MLRNKHITAIQRARQTLARQEALQTSLVYERVLKTKRRAAVRKMLAALKDVPPSRWAGEAQFSEPYLYKLLQALYVSVGMPEAISTGNRLLSRKSLADNLFEQSINDYTTNHLGDKITSISGSALDWFRNTMQQAYEDNMNVGVEELTQIMRRQVAAQYEGVAAWQIRRIVQTETMNSLNVAGRAAANSLGVAYEKTWSIAGINTRPTHQAMDGVTVDKNEPFMVGGYPMDGPMDDSHGAPPEEIINCSCTCIYLPSGNNIEEI